MAPRKKRHDEHGRFGKLAPKPIPGWPSKFSRPEGVPEDLRLENRTPNDADDAGSIIGGSFLHQKGGGGSTTCVARPWAQPLSSHSSTLTYAQARLKLKPDLAVMWLSLNIIGGFRKNPGLVLRAPIMRSIVF